MNERKRLGMDRPITRRDFLNGFALAAGALGSRSWLALAVADEPTASASDYPPALTGLRGAHDGSWEIAHALVAGRRWNEAAATGEHYDLVVVGGGISGLAAAHFYRRAAGPHVRILVLDNHDDFGGHAKRNEFRIGDRRIIGYGGSQSIDGPAGHSSIARGLYAELGIELDRFYEAFDGGTYSSLSRAMFFDRETFGADRLVSGYGQRPWREFFADAPLAARARAELVALYEGGGLELPDLPRIELTRFLKSISYQTLLERHGRVDAQVIAFLRRLSQPFWGVAIDALPAWELGPEWPGLQRLDVDWDEDDSDEPYIFHFPDGNASLARLLVRRLVPRAIPGATMEDIVTARADYRRLDEPASPVRIRLQSTVVRVEHENAQSLRIDYVQAGRARSVQADHAVLACWGTMIPHLCPELPADQRQALARLVKLPLVYANVLLRHWRPFTDLGIHRIDAPGGFFERAMLDFPVSLGAYRHSRSPEEPIILHLTRVPDEFGTRGPERFRHAREQLHTTSFEQFEGEIRAQLSRMLAGNRFDPAEDIAAITVNRWPHGYAYEGIYLWDGDLKDRPDAPWLIGRRRYGRIAIANSDAGGSAYAHVAIDQAHRAVQDLVGASRGEAVADSVPPSSPRRRREGWLQG